MTEMRARFGLATLLRWMSFLAATCAVVKTGSPGLGTAFHVCFLLTLGWAIIMSIAADGSRRCFWVGYLVFAIIYYAMLRGKLEWLYIDNKEIPLYSLVEDGVERVHPRVRRGNGSYMSAEGLVAYRASHCSIAITVAYLAGILATLVYKRRTRMPDGNSASRGREEIGRSETISASSAKAEI